MNKRKVEKRERNKKDIEWKKKVKLIFNNKCALCGKTEMLNAHHLLPKNELKYRWDIKNGIALCPNCHRFSFQISAHQNPIRFFIFLEEKYPQIIKYLRGCAKNGK